MKELRIVLIFSLAVLLSNCVNNKNMQNDKDSLVIELNFNNSVDIHDVGLIDSIDILRLSNDAILGQVDKIVKHNNCIFLLDAFITKSVFVYDLSGNFIKQLVTIGKGPKECLQPMDIFVDKKENILAVVSRTDRKLLKYNLDNLNLMSVEKLPKPFFFLSNIENGYAGCMNNLIDDNKPFNLWTMSSSFELKNSLFKIPSSWNSIASGNIQPFSRYNDKVYYIQPYDFNIYCVDEKENKVSYKYDLGSNTWPSDIKEYEDIKRINESSPDRYIGGFYTFQETQNYLITRTVFKNEELLGVYNKKTRETYVAKPSSYSDKYLISFGKIIGMDENAIYSLVTAESVNKIIVGKDKYNDFESMYPIQVKNLREKFKGVFISEEYNPFLLIHYFSEE
ncbi:6-bladed beta-propeller [Bacteroides faecalis]|uniref:6-bladed beta-propeller n=1 Tax=Bacteroides faecalis TaxID=2447885 RepID=A0A401LTM7_9BACE|nr:6-bladed beta-propeller [Bacteroides faecalis]GCB34849.1 hypothetical protein KGMB02408_17940 [Bacteroides faecalis]